MKVILAWISPRRGRSKEPEYESLLNRYLQRARAFVEITPLQAGSEQQLLDRIDRLTGRTAPVLFLLDSRGASWSSDELARQLRSLRDASTQHLVFAIGPPDGWSAQAHARGHRLLSLGPLTLPHELARVVLAEQIYRAFSILAGHPYHSRHTGE